MKHGLCARPAMRVCEDCNKYERKIYIKKVPPVKFPEVNHYAEEINKKGHNAKSIMQVMALAATKGTKLEIIVQGTDKKAKKQAVRLYHAFSSEDSYDIHFKPRKTPLQ